MNQRIASAYIEFEYQLPREKVNKGRKKKIQSEDSIKFNDLHKTYENWMNQGNGEKKSASSKIVFNRKNIKKL